MKDPRAFCQAVMHEYERQWSCAGGHAVRHPLQLKMERLKEWCDLGTTPESFEEQLRRAQASEDIGTALLAEELLPLWHTVRAGGSLPFH
jgi:hypothetical protein